MKIIVNGEPLEILEALTLTALLQKLELPMERVAVELNREVVRRAQWQKVLLKENDKIEVVHFVGGG